MKTIKDINSIIDWYAVNYSGASIELLMDSKSKLLTLCFRLAEEVADAKKGSIMSTVFRKYEHHNTKSKLLEEGFTLGKAESKSLVEIRDYLVKEAENEALSFHYKLTLDYATKIAEDLTQRISVLKNERNRTC